MMNQYLFNMLATPLHVDVLVTYLLSYFALTYSLDYLLDIYCSHCKLSKIVLI